MTNIKDIQKINVALRKGDKKKIAEMAGVHAVTVGRFLNGEDCVSDETALNIIKCSAKVIKNRGKLKTASEKIIETI